MRAFFAIELPDAVRAAARRSALALAQAVPSARVPPEENLHVTLAFLGEVDEGAIEDLTLAVATALPGRSPFPMQLGSAGRFPPRGRPRIVWIGVSRGAHECGDLAARVAAACGAAGRSVDERPFHAHVTVARVGTGRSGRGARVPAGAAEAVDRWARSVEEIPCGPGFEVRRVVLFESTLAPGGSRYRERAAIELPRDVGRGFTEPPEAATLRP